MADYAFDYAENITNLRYGDWLHREASVRDMKPSDLEKEIEISTISVSQFNVCNPAWSAALAKFNREAQKYNVVTDLTETYSSGMLGVSPSLTIRGTGVKFKSK